MDYELNQAAKKLEQFAQFCEENGLNAQDCLVIGDGENDEKLFEACGHGVLIGADPESETFAWRRIDRLAEFEYILQEN